MGCFISKPKEETEHNEILLKDDLKISTIDLISEKTGKITKDYKIFNPPLGKGAFGEVRKALHKKSNIYRAIKIMSKSNTSKEEQEKMINEIEILKMLDHPNIIKIFEFYQDENFFYIVTELCQGGELFDKILEEKTFSEKKAANIMRQLLSAVFYCHSHNIVHRDIKPENLLLESRSDNSLIKVIDFGTSLAFNPTKKMHQKFGTPYYIAPEVLKKQYDHKCDIWSCGVILYILLCGYPPFNGSNDESIMNRVAKGIYSFKGEEWKAISQEAKDFISRMLEFNPERRYSAEQAYSDPWLKKWTDQDEADIPVISRSLENMKNFRAEQRLQEITWVFLVNYLTSKEEKGELLKIFRTLDLDGDGRLSKEELYQGMRKIMNEAQAHEECERLMKLVDRDNSGYIEYIEFMIATIDKENLLTKQRLETAFKMLDKDDSGNVSVEELKEFFGGDKIKDNVWKEIIKEVDSNGDGEISYEEFKGMMMSMLNTNGKANLLKERK